MVPIPAIKNGMDTCNVVFHHSSCFKPVPAFTVSLSSTFSCRSPPSPPLGSSDDTIDVVVVELNERTDEAGGKLEYFSCSLSAIEERTVNYLHTNLLQSSLGL